MIVQFGRQALDIDMIPVIEIPDPDQFMGQSATCNHQNSFHWKPFRGAGPDHRLNHESADGRFYAARFSAILA